MKTKILKKQHTVGKIFALAVVMMMGVAFTACSSDEEPKPDPDAVKYVDLALPSGTKWATCNLGATKPEEPGYYYAWGETKPKASYDWTTYKWMQKGKSSWKNITKYTFADGKTDAIWYDSEGNFIGDGKTTLEPENDAATVKLGAPWRTPTADDIRELINNCNWEWTEINGVKGYKVIGTNDNFIFLPAAGYRVESELKNVDILGSYLSSSLYTGNCSCIYNLYFLKESINCPNDDRYFGNSVRAVRK